MNLTVVDHIAAGRDALARAAKLAGEGTTLAQREAHALREAQAMKSEALMGMHYRIREHACPACGAWTLMPHPRQPLAFCVNRHCAVAGRQRRWEFRELAFIGPGTPKPVRQTDSELPPRDVMDKRRLLAFFAQTGRPMSASTLRRVVKAHDLPTWTNPLDARSPLYSLSDVATAHAVHMAHREGGDCTARSNRPPCVGLADLFFSAGEDPKLRETAKSLCNSCPLKAACLETALTHSYHSQHGIVGGLTAKERRGLKTKSRVR